MTFTWQTTCQVCGEIYDPAKAHQCPGQWHRCGTCGGYYTQATGHVCVVLGPNSGTDTYNTITTTNGVLDTS